VKSHVKHVFTKLAVRDRSQAVIAAYESGLVVAGGGVTPSTPPPAAPGLHP